MNADSFNKEEVSISLSSKGYPLPIELRPLWRLGVMCLCISLLGSSKYGLSFIKLKVATWMLLRPQLWSGYEESLNDNTVRPASVGDDRNTDKAMELGFSKNLFFLDKNNFKLLPAGEELLALCSELRTFSNEEEFLISIKSKFTNAYVDRVMERE